MSSNLIPASDDRGKNSISICAVNLLVKSLIRTYPKGLSLLQNYIEIYIIL